MVARPFGLFVFMESDYVLTKTSSKFVNVFIVTEFNIT